MKDIPETCCSH